MQNFILKKKKQSTNTIYTLFNNIVCMQKIRGHNQKNYYSFMLHILWDCLYIIHEYEIHIL